MDRHLGTKEEERQNEKSRDIQVGPSSEALAVQCENHPPTIANFLEVSEN